VDATSARPLASPTGLQAFTDALKLIRALPDAGLTWIGEINLADVAALDAVLTGLDELAAAPTADESFDLRDLGAA